MHKKKKKKNQNYVFKNGNSVLRKWKISLCHGKCLHAKSGNATVTAMFKSKFVLISAVAETWNSGGSVKYRLQWSLYFKTTHGPRKCGLILQVVLK